MGSYCLCKIIISSILSINDLGDTKLITKQYTSSSVTIDVGTLQTFDLQFLVTSDLAQLVVVNVLDIRISNLALNESPTLTVTSNDFVNLDAFEVSIPSGLRGPTATTNIVPTDGGYLLHAKGTNTIVIKEKNYISTKPAGYLHLVK